MSEGLSIATPKEVPYTRVHATHRVQRRPKSRYSLLHTANMHTYLPGHGSSRRRRSREHHHPVDSPPLEPQSRRRAPACYREHHDDQNPRRCGIRILVPYMHENSGSDLGHPDCPRRYAWFFFFRILSRPWHPLVRGFRSRQVLDALHVPNPPYTLARRATIAVDGKLATHPRIIDLREDLGEGGTHSSSQKHPS